MTMASERYVLRPHNRNNDVWALYKDAEASFWTAEEIDFSRDRQDFQKLSSEEQQFLKKVLAFFAASDGIVNENIGVNLYEMFTEPEERCFYGFQMAIENIHSEAYALMIDSIIELNEQETLFSALENDDTIKRKADWCQQWMNNKNPLLLLAFACVEGIFFSASFAAIYWIKTKGLMPGLTFSNELIARDEGMHTDFGCLMFNKYKHDSYNKDVARSIVVNAVNLEKAFIKEALPERLLGMNKDLMIQYVKFVADRLLTQVGLEKVYYVVNPFPFMDNISVQNKTNFFEARVGAYQRPGVSTGAATTLKFTDDF